MSVDYSQRTKKIKEVYSREKDEFGRDVERRLLWNHVYFVDADNGGFAQGPFIEPDNFRNPAENYPGDQATDYEYPVDIIGRDYLNNAQDGDKYSFWIGNI